MPLLGEFFFPLSSFSSQKEALNLLSSSSFLALPEKNKLDIINEALFSLLKKEKTPCFLLPATLSFIEIINQKKALKEEYSLHHFEFWLNQNAKISYDENLFIRGQITGKFIPRETYQNLFPIGMDKTFFGTHFVTAHIAPDVDTTVASFFGWLDAFSAKIGTGLHRWSLPGGPPLTPFSKIFEEILGKNVFDSLARKESTLTLNAMDLLIQEGIRFIEIKQESLQEQKQGVIFLLDQEGKFLGDWRKFDLESVRPFIISFKGLLHHFENKFTMGLISLFSKSSIQKEDLKNFYKQVFEQEMENQKETDFLSEIQKKELHLFFQKILTLPKGLQSTLQEFFFSFKKSIPEVSLFEKEKENLLSTLFTSDGKLQEDRSSIFQNLQKIFQILDQLSEKIRNFMERLDVMIQIKSQVLSLPMPFVTLQSDVEEIRLKIENLDYLVVFFSDEEKHQTPLGIVRAVDLKKSVLGTVSLRDFCNLQEIKMASYLEIISVVDHHKTSLTTLTPPRANISDAQSCNVLMAEESFLINDEFSLGGMSKEEIEEEIKLVSHQNFEVFEKLLKKKKISEKQSSYFISKEREFLEYFCFLQAILDDTDLLSKVSKRDVRCVMYLLNRLKSLSLGKVVEVVSDQDLFGKEYAKSLAKRILQNEDMYSIYKRIYFFKQKEMEENFLLFEKGKENSLFIDTKEQNGFARIGQTKIFSSNVKMQKKLSSLLQQEWAKKAKEIYQTRPEIDFHLHMISTIPSAKEVYQGEQEKYEHQDELWFWIAPSQLAFNHLNGFLSAFQFAPELKENHLSLEIFGKYTEELSQAFLRNFLSIPIQKKNKNSEISYAVLHFNAGELNSRKAMVSPYLPQFIP